jgi:hypothetical protein
MRAAKAAGSRKPSRSKLFRIKVISMGDQAVGKSCLIKRYAADLTPPLRCWGLRTYPVPIKVGKFVIAQVL